MKQQEYENYFQEFVRTWPKDAAYYVWGTSNTARIMCDLFKGSLNVIGFVDNDQRKWGTQFLGRPVFSPDKFLSARGDAQCIIASLANSEIAQELKRRGLRGDVDFCGSDYFVTIHQYLDTGKLFFYRNSLSITTYCSLRCRHCCMKVPYYKQREHRSVDDVLADVDAYFQWVDHVMRFDILGGEPLVHPDVDEITEKIAQRYRSRIDELTLLTNGTVMPSEKMLGLMERYHMRVEISDYRKTIPAIRPKVDKLIEALQSRGIIHVMAATDAWIDWNYIPEDRTGWSAEKLAAYCRNCGTFCQGIYKKKFYYCYNHLGGALAGVCPDEPGDYFDLTAPVDAEQKGKLILFNLNCMPKGYESYCRQCAGWRAVNLRIIPAAEQLPPGGPAGV